MWLEQRGRDWAGPRPTVDDGYDISVDFRRNGQRVGRVGRGKIYEQLAIQRLAGLKEKKTAGGVPGLFYPGATMSAELVSQAVLYFNEVFIIHPGSTLFDEWLEPHYYDESEHIVRYRESLDTFIAGLQRFDAAMLPLKRAGVLWALPPQMQERPDFIDLVCSDVDDPEFRDIVEADWRSPLFVAATKMEPLLPLVGESRPGKLELVEELRHRAGYASWKRPPEEELFAPMVYGVKQVEPVLAASILLNHAFLLSEQHGMVPFTDDSMCMRLMQRKLKRVCEMPGFHDFRRMLDLGTASLSMRVLEEHVPRFSFTTAEDILVAREKLAEQLDAFRQAMAALAAGIEEWPYDNNFMRRVEQVTATKVRPAISALEGEIRTSRDSFITKCIRNTQAGTVPVVGSIMAGLPASAVIAISAGVLTFEAAVETYLELSRKKRNGFTLLLKKHDR